MNTLPIDLYKVIEYGLGGDTWQEFIDRYKEKYDHFKLMVLNLKQPSWIILSPSLLRASA